MLPRKIWEAAGWLEEIAAATLSITVTRVTHLNQHEKGPVTSSDVQSALRTVVARRAGSVHIKFYGGCGCTLHRECSDWAVKLSNRNAVSAYCTVKCQQQCVQRLLLPSDALSWSRNRVCEWNFESDGSAHTVRCRHQINWLGTAGSIWVPMCNEKCQTEVLPVTFWRKDRNKSSHCCRHLHSHKWCMRLDLPIQCSSNHHILETKLNPRLSRWHVPGAHSQKFVKAWLSVQTENMLSLSS